MAYTMKKFSDYRERRNYAKTKNAIENPGENGWTLSNDEKELKELMKNDPKIKEEYETNKKLANDPRITKVGKFIRATCIDEMPQFLNLLKGDMTLVGPRPYLFGEVKDIGDSFDTIVSVKPGITGLWQVSEKSDMSFKRRCVIDKYYANNLNLRLDIKIFFKTFSTIIFNKGTK